MGHEDAPVALGDRKCPPQVLFRQRPEDEPDDAGRDRKIKPSHEIAHEAREEEESEVECRTVDGIDAQRGEHEYQVLKSMESSHIPTPHVCGWDPEGKWLGVPCFLSDFIKGDSLLSPMLDGEVWAEELFLDTVCSLQFIERDQLGPIGHILGTGESASDILDQAYAFFQEHPHSLADLVYNRLKSSMPDLPRVRFSNGDLWLDNMIVHEHKLSGVIDFENAGFSDPVYEFLLPFFIKTDLRNRGIEGRYCQRMGFDPGMLPWYHALEYFDTWHWLVKTGQPFEKYTADGLEEILTRWLKKDRPI